jgi:hypothetical protein
MSQNRDVTFDDGAQPLDVARILAGLDPEPLRIERDELFFRAGFAAGSRSHSSVRLWQATAAALLIACIGLSAAAFRQVIIPTSDSNTVALVKPPVADSPTIASKNPIDPSPADLRTRKWQQLASADMLPPGRLTALGWSELSSEELAARSSNSADAPPASDSKPISSRLTPEILKSLHLPTEG